MTKTTAVALSLLLVLLVVAVYPLFQPEPPMEIDPALFTPEMVVTPDQPPKPDDSPGQSHDDAGLPVPATPPLPPTAKPIEQPGGVAGPCANGQCQQQGSGTTYRRGLFSRRR